MYLFAFGLAATGALLVVVASLCAWVVKADRVAAVKSTRQIFANDFIYFFIFRFTVVQNLPASYQTPASRAKHNFYLFFPSLLHALHFFPGMNESSLNGLLFHRHALQQFLTAM
jgi:hypothetical protein